MLADAPVTRAALARIDALAARVDVPLVAIVAEAMAVDNAVTLIDADAGTVAVATALMLADAVTGTAPDPGVEMFAEAVAARVAFDWIAADADCDVDCDDRMAAVAAVDCAAVARIDAEAIVA